jgi:dethiobiotin synthetase
MTRKRVRGLFITGNDTNVGKTRVAAIIARELTASGRAVGVYKPAASGCRWEASELVSDDALALWQAAGQPAELARVAPQRFVAPLAPHVAAEKEGKQLDRELLRSGLDFWLDRSEIVIIEGAGGLLSPLGDEYVADVAYDLGFPLVVVVRNALGAINQGLMTLVAAAAFRDSIPVAGIVLCETDRDESDLSRASNRTELERCAGSPVLGSLPFGGEQFDPPIDWWSIAGESI